MGTRWLSLSAVSAVVLFALQTPSFPQPDDVDRLEDEIDQASRTIDELKGKLSDAERTASGLSNELLDLWEEFLWHLSIFD